MTLKKQEMREKVNDFVIELTDQERTKGTITMYKRVVTKFLDTMPDEISKADVIAWKTKITEEFKPSTVRNYILIVNKFIAYCEYGTIEHTQKSTLEVKQIRQQKSFTVNNVISNSETQRMIKYAKKLGYEDMALIIEILVDTGIRINELKEFTVENLNHKTQLKIISKGKIREITIPDRLKKSINEYIKDHNIESGYLFTAPKKKDQLISRFTVDKRLKYIAGKARISLKKAHAHSFRHLFAKNAERAGYATETIADILGHSSVETTRKYMRKNDEEMKEIMNELATKRTEKRGKNGQKVFDT